MQSANWILLIIALVVSLAAQYKVSSTYRTYAKVRARSNMAACEVAREMLDFNGLTDVRIEQIRGDLTDHYDPRQKVLRLSESTYHSSSVAALGVAAHEVGHAFQDAEGYGPLRIRSLLAPVASIGSNFSFFLIILGIFMSSYNLVDIGILLFSFVVIFQLVTLPVEFNASTRALASLEGGGFLTAEETDQTAKVLKAAAYTYVAAALVGILQLLRLLLLFGNRRR